jgi:PII-like signaling protein
VVEAALALARRHDLAARVTRAEEGWSAHGGARTTSQVELSDDLPIIIELIGANARIQALLPELVALASTHGTITLTAARVFEE